MEDVLPELVQLGQHPRYMLVENVAGFEVRPPFSAQRRPGPGPWWF